MLDEGSVAARLLIVVLCVLGCTAVTWYQGRTWKIGLRAWHGALLGLVGGIVVAFVLLD